MIREIQQSPDTMKAAVILVNITAVKMVIGQTFDHDQNQIFHGHEIGNYLTLFSGVSITCEIKERQGFLKNVCDEDGRVFRCIYSDTYYVLDSITYDWETYSNLCPNDPYFYQMCDLESIKKMGGTITNNEVLCGGYFCRGPFDSYFITSFRIDASFKSFYDCLIKNASGEEEEEESVILLRGYRVRPMKICNNECDGAFCYDEAVCNGYMYGIQCKISSYIDIVFPKRICDNYKECDQGEDEANCTVNDETDTTCKHFTTGNLVPVHNFTRCGPISLGIMLYCRHEDTALYQTNCSDPERVGLRCEINGYMSTVSKYIICEDDISACDDNLDSSCFETATCKIHKHLMCNGKVDCTGKVDETHQICISMTNQKCRRRADLINDELPIPLSWLQDGVKDCENGIDETSYWPTCGQGPTLRMVPSNDTKCENVYLCRTGYPGYIELDKLCDGLDTCGNENKVCSVSSRSYTIATSVFTTNKGLVKRLSYCMKGMKSLEQLKGSCVAKQFIYPDEDIFGVTETSLILPNLKHSCDHMYGEQYLYTSCTGRCSDSSCPLRTIPRYEVCPSQFPDRVGTIVNNKYLMFLTRSYGSLYTNRYFVCEDNTTCVDYSKVCDLVYDCADRSDESSAYCTNHFVCTSSKNLLPKTKQCDGHIDCADLSDECNELCSKSILEGAFIEGLSWTIGSLAVVANLVIIGRSLWTLKRCKTAVAVMNRCLIIMIAFGDFLIGCYLSIISIYDTFIYEGNYCTKQVEWITSIECSAIGVLSTIGSQISLFCMTGLSVIRLYGIRNSMNISGQITKSKILKIAIIVLILIAASVLIAVLPVIGMFEDFFVNALKFSDKLKIFIGTTEKQTVLSAIQAYYGRTKKTTLKWERLTEIVQNMFSKQPEYDDFTKKIDKVDFYGNDGVCLFKYFVQKEDPQKMFVWSILTINFICFLTIAFSYLLIGIITRRSSEGLAMSQNNRQITQRNRRTNRRIAIIITTDFLCWIPFITTCVLHSLEIVDATSWYDIFSMIILPINSVINPFLYDGAITDAIVAFFGFSTSRISNSLGSTGSQITARVTNSVLFQSARESSNPPPTEVVELDVIAASDTKKTEI